MNHRLSILAVTLAAVLMTGCGGPGGDDEITSRPARSGPGATVGVESYVDGVCTSMDEMVRTLAARVARLAASIPPEADLAQAQQLLTAAFQQVDTAFVELARDVAAAGIPDTEDGIEFTRALQSNLTKARTAFRGAGEDFVALLDDVEDFPQESKKFAAKVTRVTKELGGAFPAAFPALDAAARESETCRQIGTGGLPPG